MCFGRLIAYFAPANRDRAGHREDRPTIAQPGSAAEQPESDHEQVEVSPEDGHAIFPDMSGRSPGIDRELYTVSTLEPTLDSFVDILGITVGRHRAIKELQTALRLCEDDLKNVQMDQDECDVMIDFLMSKVDEYPELTEPMDYYGQMKEDAEQVIEEREEAKKWFQGKLKEAAPELIKATNDMYRHASAFFSAIREEQIEHGSILEEFINALKLTIACRAVVERVEEQYREARADFNNSNRRLATERSRDEYRESPAGSEHSATERQRKRRELRHRWRIAEKRRQVQRANQAEREMKLLEDHAVPFLQQCGKLPLSISGNDSVSSHHAPKSATDHGWASEPEFRREMRHVRAEVFESHRELARHKNDYLFRMAYFLFTHPNATKEEWDRKWASEGITGWGFEEAERQWSQMIEITRARYALLRREAEDRGDLFLPLSTTQLASRSGDGASGSAPAAIRREYPQYLLRTGIHRNVYRWLSGTVTEGSASIGARTASSVDSNNARTPITRTPSPSIRGESLAMCNAREARIRRMSLIRDALREQGAHLRSI